MQDKPKIRTRNVNAKLTAQDLGYKTGYNQKVITVSPKNAVFNDSVDSSNSKGNSFGSNVELSKCNVTFSDWPDESRIDAIGQNGNTGEHYNVQ